MGRLMRLLCSCMLASACQVNAVSPLPAAPSVTAPPRPLPAADGPATIPGTPIAPGQTVTAVVGLGDPNCFINWDASGLCRQFDLTATGDGTLSVTMTWAGPARGVYDPDLFLVFADGSWLLGEGAWPTRRLSSPGKNGSRYRIVVLSYGQALDFQLSADLKP